MVPCTWRAPAAIAANELATATPESSCAWTPTTISEGTAATTAAALKAELLVDDDGRVLPGGGCAPRRRRTHLGVAPLGRVSVAEQIATFCFAFEQTCHNRTAL